jgi:hypothetical protein
VRGPIDDDARRPFDARNVIAGEGLLRGAPLPEAVVEFTQAVGAGAKGAEGAGKEAENQQVAR